MLCLYSSKKKRAEAQRMERADSFYEVDMSYDSNNYEADNNGMDDNEYRRRVAEEIGKRKTIARGGKVYPQTSTSTQRKHSNFSPSPSSAQKFDRELSDSCRSSVAVTELSSKSNFFNEVGKLGSSIS